MVGDLVVKLGVGVWLTLFVLAALVLPVGLNLRRYKFEGVTRYMWGASFRIVFTVLGAALAALALVESKGSWVGWAIYVNTMGLLGYQMLRDSASDFRALVKAQPKRT